MNDLSLITANTQLLQDGDVVIADTAEDDTVGKTIEVQNLGNGKLVAGLHTIPCRVKKGDFAPGWLGYYMNSYIYHDQIIPFITGIKVSSISKTAIAETIILVPPVEEQERIVETLSQLDSLIKQETSVSEKLNNVKSSCLSKIFPKDDEKKPEMRFPEFTDTWEQREVEDIAENTYGGGTPQTSIDSFWNGDIPWIQSQDIIENQLFDVAPRKHISEEAISKSATKLVPKNSIAIVTRVGVGKLAFMPFSYCTSQDFLSLSRIRIDEKFATYSIYKMLQKEKQNVQGTSIKGITIEEMLSKKIEVPCNIAEQQQIGTYFRNLDNLITLHQRKCDKYKSIKAGLIRKLFP